MHAIVVGLLFFVPVVSVEAATVTRAISSLVDDVSTVTLTVGGTGSETWYLVEEHPPTGWVIETLDWQTHTPASDGSLRIACIEALGCTVEDRSYVYTVRRPVGSSSWTFWGLSQFESDTSVSTVLGDTQSRCVTDAECDNTIFCDGVETCSEGVCQGGTLCVGWPFCDESTDSCVECLLDAHCDNGDFCDGSETCSAGVCQPGTPPPSSLSNTTIVGPATYQTCGSLTVGPSVTITGGAVVLRAETAVYLVAPITIETVVQIENGSPIP